MARPHQEKPFTAPYSPITEREKEGAAADDDYGEADSDGCFRRFCSFGWNHEGRSRNYLLFQERGGGAEEPWVVAKLKKAKELSEVVAGPKWKNLIRKIGKLCNPRTQKVQYSPESYALNFSGDDHGEADANLLHSFSSRFASLGAINDHQRRAAGL